MESCHGCEDDDADYSARERRGVAVHFPVEARGFGRVLSFPGEEARGDGVDHRGRMDVEVSR